MSALQRCRPALLPGLLGLLAGFGLRGVLPLAADVPVTPRPDLGPRAPGRAFSGLFLKPPTSGLGLEPV